ncbi:elongation factor G [Marispirochaeta aestuarii]|uniref:Elongation factor G n=1 Tax=Marispirochaeta aestuarii TaxID=1963862 RepID=A0A1Y1RU47_9SPIO|nr:elongation factor G [Marispirochaeta aestuarii]ORC31849.1 elongation factor G [Marispirochaeta aestuarii]
MSFSTADIRNIALVGHGSTGKTTLLEQLLFNSGVIDRAEPVESGKTVSDYTEEEVARGISIHTTLSSCTWNDHQVNLLDTPGSSDFIGEVVAAFRCAESALMVVDGRDGVQIETIKLWRRLDQRNKPRFCFINRLDRDRADFEHVFNDLKEKFKMTFVPVTIPMMDGGEYKGIINLIENKAYMMHDGAEKDQPVDIPEQYNEMVEEYRLTLIESAAEGEDSLMEKYFEEGTLSPDEIRKGLIEGLRENKIVPTLCGSALNNNGVVSLLNFISNITPSPSGIPELAQDKDKNEIKVDISDQGPLAGMVFRTSIDQFSGKLSFIKVIGGILVADSEILNCDTGKKERISKLYKTVGKKLVETKELRAGDLGVVTKVEGFQTNTSFCTPDTFCKFDRLHLPQPVFSLAISAASKKEEDKLNASLHRAAEEDLTFQVTYDKETHETVISGMGELHINMILDKIKEKQKIEIETKVPRVAYRETITRKAGAEYTHKKQSGGHGQYGRVVMDIGPIERGKYMEFYNDIKGGSISKGYMPGIEKGILEGMEEGYLAGYPLVDIEAHIIDGKEHPVDSSEMAFKLAAKGALKSSLEKAGVVLLEPVMKLRVFVDEQYLGDILSDLSSRRGRVLGQESLGGGINEVDAEVPQAEMLRYAIDLKSMTSGTGSFEMEFDHYSPISGRVADLVIQEAQSLKAAEE